MEKENRGKKWEKPVLAVITTADISENVLVTQSGLPPWKTQVPPNPQP